MADAPDLNLNVVARDLVTPGLEAAAASTIASADKLNAKLLAGEDASQKARIALQRNSITVNERMEEQRVRAAQASAIKILEADKQLAIAKASSLTNQFEKWRAVEIAKTNFAQEQLYIQVTNEELRDKLIEAERLRHTAKMIGFAEQEAAYASKPFNRLLTEVATLAGLGGLKARAAEGLTESAEAKAASSVGGAEAGALGAGGAIGGGAAAISAAAGIGIAALAIEHLTKVGIAARDAEDALNASLEISGRQATLSADKLNEYAEALSNVTKFDKAQAEAAIASLIPYKNITDEQLPLLIKLTADYAAKTGKDMPEAAKLLGRAFEDPAQAARVLKDAYVILSDAEKKQLQRWEKEGELGKEQEFLYKRLSAAVGGYATDTVHSTQILGNAWHEFEDILGKGVTHVEDLLADLAMISPGPILSFLAHINPKETIASAFVGTPEKTKEMTDEQKTELNKYSTELQEAQDQAAAIGEKSAAARMTRELAAEKKHYKDLQDVGFLSDKAEAAEKSVHEQRMSNIRAQGHEDEITEAQAQAAKLLALQEKSQRARSDLEFAEARAAKERVSSNPLEPLADKRAALNDEKQADLDALETKYNAAKKSNLLSQQEEERYRKARFDIADKYDKKDQQLVRDEIARKKHQTDQEIGFGLQIAGNLAEVAAIAGAKGKALFAIQQSIALGTIAVKTAEAVVTDNSNPLTMWKVPFDIALGASESAVVAATTIKGFQGGGWTGEGSPSTIAGVVHKSEYVVPAPAVLAMGGPAGVEAALAGGGDNYHFGPIHLPSGTTPAQAEKIGYALTDGARRAVRDNAMLTRMGSRFGQQV